MRYRTELMQSILTSETAQKIIDYVSPIYGNSYVGLWIFQAIGTALDDVCTIAEQLCYETNPSTAELLLDYWERRYGLPMDSSLTTEQRRTRILARRQSRGPCNPARLASAVSAALNGVDVDITENVVKNRFHVHVLGNVDSLAPAVFVIERMKPAHLVYDISVTVQTEATAELNIATAVTHTERFSMQVEEPRKARLLAYVEGETLVLSGDAVSVEGETLRFTDCAVVDGETLRIENGG